MTTQEELRIAAQKAETNKDLYEIADKFARDIMHSYHVFWGIDKKPSGYGTYKVLITFANEYHYGRDLAERLVKNTSYRITHDEDAEFDLEDFIDDITEICYEMAEKYHDEKEDAE